MKYSILYDKLRLSISKFPKTVRDIVIESKYLYSWKGLVFIIYYLNFTVLVTIHNIDNIVVNTQNVTKL